MPREVYETAVRGLGTLVSPRAASRLVDSALRAASRTPEDISAKAMRRLLLGRIRHELHGVLPGPALEAGLNRVATEVEHRAAAASKAKQTAVGFQTRAASRAAQPPARRGFNPFRRRGPNARAGSGPDGATDAHGADAKSTNTPLGEALLDPATLTSPEAVKRSSVYLPGLTVPEELRPEGRAVVIDEPSSAAARHPTLAERPAGPAAADAAATAAPQASAPARRLRLDDATVEAAVKAFAEVETVRQIVITRGAKVLQTRGGGVDADRLAPLAVSTRALLERAGQLHVYSVEHPGGVLFLFPLHDGTVSVLTQPNVNIGAVLAARAALEEAA